jgi:hypothetical protein
MTTETKQPQVVMLAVLPGPDRKRTDRLYHYRISYRSPEPASAGCVSSWEVSGGRLTYQVALERDEGGRLHWHCSCADAVYRGELKPGHVCKHVRGLLAFAPPVPAGPALRRSA